MFSGIFTTIRNYSDKNQSTATINTKYYNKVASSRKCRPLCLAQPYVIAHMRNCAHTYARVRAYIYIYARVVA